MRHNRCMPTYRTPAPHLMPTETPLPPGEDSSSSPHSPHISRPQKWPLPALEEPNLTWGDLQGVELHQTMKETFDEVVHWRRNLFQVLSGSAGKAFVAELAWPYQAYADGSSLESVALMACSVAPILLLQKPGRTSKSKDHTIHLQRRLDLWLNGELRALVNEGRCIQKHLRTGTRRKDDDEAIARTFRDLILNGKVMQRCHALSVQENRW